MAGLWSWGSVVALVAAMPGLALAGDVQASAAPAPLIKEPAAGIELAFVKGGCFRMGDIFNDESHERAAGVAVEDPGDTKPVHQVCVGDYYIGKFEVTRGQWKSLMGNDPSSPTTCSRSDCPVDNVSWRDVETFIKKLNAKDARRRFRLPTEAEWEYAARSGGKDERYSGGNDVESVSWYEGTTRELTDRTRGAQPVGTRASNGLGIHDMSGNVYELTSDWYGATYYSSSARDNPRGPDSGEQRVERGGCASGSPGNSRVARRGEFAGGATSGFRIVREL